MASSSHFTPQFHFCVSEEEWDKIAGEMREMVVS